MYYEEEFIDGVWYWRNTPNGEWIVKKVQMSKADEEKLSARATPQISELKQVRELAQKLEDETFCWSNDCNHKLAYDEWVSSTASKIIATLDGIIAGQDATTPAQPEKVERIDWLDEAIDWAEYAIKNNFLCDRQGLSPIIKAARAYAKLQGGKE